MTIPFRRWISFDRATLEGYYSGAGNTSIDWTERYQNLCKLGGRNPSSTPKNFYWHSVFRPRRGLGFESLTGMDQIVSVAWNVLIARQHILSFSDTTRFDLVQGFVDNANPWHYLRATGKYYDGENVWDAYPPQQHAGYNNPQITIGALWMHEAVTCYMYSWKAGGGNGVEANRYMNDFFRGGSHFLLSDYQPAFPADGKRCRIILNPHYMDVQYFNPVVNQCRVNDVVQYWVPVDTAVELKLIGMGFKNDDDELDGEGDSRGGGWGDLVDVIEFWKQQDAAMAYWRDEFAGTALEAGWTSFQTDAQRTIVEAGGVLTYTIDDGTDALWHGYGGSPKNLGPRIYRTLDATPPCEIITKLNSSLHNDGEFVGMFIATTPEGMADGDAYLLGLCEPNYVVMNVGTAPYLAETAGPYYVTPQWLKIKIDSSQLITFWRSADGITWVEIQGSVGPYRLSGYYTEGIKVGLFASNNRDYWKTDQAVSAPFEFFEVNSGGTPYAILKETDGDFTVDTNLQITIPIGKFPALPEGSYILRLIKEGMDFSPRNSDVDVWGWAGDWRCTAGGLVSEGARIVIEAQVGPALRRPREQRGSIILIEADKQHKATLAVTKERWSEDDVRAPDKLYEGIVMETSSFRRAIDDKIGMFKIADATLKLANHKKKFSTLLETYDFKNQLVRLYHAFIDEPEYWKTHIVTMIAEDYNIEGTSFELILKDVSQKYFGVDVPLNVCIEGSGEGEYPNLHEDYIGLAMPEILGVASLTEGENKGAVQAIYVDTVAYRYLAAAGILHSITEVYADNELVDPSGYEIYAENGRTIIDFVSDQADKEITFNCTGYMYGGWNSVNGYIQNPAWILAYYLSNILSVPLFLLDDATFTALANIYIAMTEERSGKLILQDQRGSAEVLRELCFSFGAKCWVSKTGSFAVGRKSLTGITSDTVLFEQADLLGPVKRKMGMRDSITHIEGHFDYIPVHNLFKGTRTATRDDLEERYRERREDRIERRFRDRRGGS